MTSIHNNDQEQSNTSKKGTASMPRDKVQEIASKGGHASAEQAGHEGMAKRGRKSGQTSSAKSIGYDDEEEE